MCRLLCRSIGADTTTEGDGEVRPRQDEFPVWYFLYGTLGRVDVLGRVLGVGC